MMLLNQRRGLEGGRKAPLVLLNMRLWKLYYFRSKKISKVLSSIEIVRLDAFIFGVSIYSHFSLSERVLDTSKGLCHKVNVIPIDYCQLNVPLVHLTGSSHLIVGRIMETTLLQWAYTKELIDK